VGGANSLEFPSPGDVTFECPTAVDGVTRRLYTSPILLKDRSSYFNKCIPPYHSNPGIDSFSTREAYVAIASPGIEDISQYSPPYPAKILPKIVVKDKLQLIPHNIVLYPQQQLSPFAQTPRLHPSQKLLSTNSRVSAPQKPSTLLQLAWSSMISKAKH
jgi:hypothetical protein